MSFRCQKCDKPQSAGTAPVRRIVEKREKEYYGGNRGWEIVKEHNLCRPCSDPRLETPVR